MTSTVSGGDDATSDLLISIVETLESVGINHEEYRLNDFIDVDALERLLDSARNDVEVRCTVSGTRIAITPDDVWILEEVES